MADIKISIHCDAVVARAQTSEGSEWVTLAFKSDAKPTVEVTLFLPRGGSSKLFSDHIRAFNDEVARGKMPAQKPQERFTIGKQPCQDFLRGDADIAALGDGNRRNLHQCPKCSGNRAWCDNCCTDHHDGGWESCQPDAYDYHEDDAP